MAKLSEGYMGGFVGKLGTAVGYQWKGKWCLRGLPSRMRNPRTEAQQEHRMLFKQEVQLAGYMRRALNVGLAMESDLHQMTALNLFVKINQPAFAAGNADEPESAATPGNADLPACTNRLEVDWENLIISAGPVAPVAFGAPTVTGGTTLELDFERNPLHLRAGNFDKVYLYIYSPELEQGYLTAPVYRSARHIAVVLPQLFAGHEVHLYGFVQDEQGRCSQTIYIGHGPLTDGAADEAADVSETLETSGLHDEMMADGLPAPPVAQGVDTPRVRRKGALSGPPVS